MRTDINTINISTFFTQEGYHFLVYLLEFIPCDLSSCYHRLVCDNNRQISTLVNKLNCLSYSFYQFKVIYIAKESHIFIDGSITIKKYGFLLVGKILSLNNTIFIVSLHLMKTFWSTHILYIFRTIITEHHV